ncbi:MAG: hypothetical protein JW943_13045, partial [Deltaproteobacteria bacterium]|nr:hypothetical protein [Deltaproteobacteria bacterium]
MSFRIPQRRDEESEVVHIIKHQDFSPAKYGVEMTKKLITTQSTAGGDKNHNAPSRMETPIHNGERML